MRLIDTVPPLHALTIEADPGRLPDARDWARRVAAAAGFGDSDRYQLRLAMSEAVANAIQHGSDAHTDQIELQAFEHDGALVFEVSDKGTFAGFAPARADLDAESGRGLELLTLMMDDVRMSSTAAGSRLRFSKRLP